MDYEQKPLKAVHENDLDFLLVKIGRKEDFDQKNIKCKFCKTVITKENLYSILPEAGAFNFVCEESDCVKQLLEYLDERKNLQTEQ